MNETADFLFRCNPEPGWIQDRDTHRFLAVNQAAVVVYGYSEDEFLGMTAADIRLADGHPQPPKQDGSLPPAPADPRRWRNRRKNGEVIVVELRAFPVVFMDRPAEIVTARDVTDLALLEMAAAKQLRKEREYVTSGHRRRDDIPRLTENEDLSLEGASCSSNRLWRSISSVRHRQEKEPAETA